VHKLLIIAGPIKPFSIRIFESTILQTIVVLYNNVNQWENFNFQSITVDIYLLFLVCYLRNSYSTNVSLQAAIKALQYPGGTTDTVNAIHLMRTQEFNPYFTDRPGVNKTAIIITDGKPTSVVSLPEEEAAAQNQGIRMYAVGITDQVDENTLKGLSSPPQLVPYIIIN